MDADPKGLQREATALGERFASNMEAPMFFMLPLFALWQMIVYWNGGLRCTCTPSGSWCWHVTRLALVSLLYLLTLSILMAGVVM